MAISSPRRHGNLLVVPGTGHSIAELDATTGKLVRVIPLKGSCLANSLRRPHLGCGESWEGTSDDVFDHRAGRRYRRNDSGDIGEEVQAVRSDSHGSRWGRVGAQLLRDPATRGADGDKRSYRRTRAHNRACVGTTVLTWRPPWPAATCGWTCPATLATHWRRSTRRREGRESHLRSLIQVRPLSSRWR